MKKAILKPILAILTAATVVAAFQSSSAGAVEKGFDTVFFRPQYTGHGGMTTWDAETADFLNIQTALIIDGCGPMIRIESNGTEKSLLGYTLGLNFLTMIGLGAGTEVGLSIPVIPWRQVEDAAALSSAGIGDIGLIFRARFLGKNRGDFRMGAGAEVFFPSGSSEKFTGSGTFTFAAFLAAEKFWGPFGIYGNVGYHYMPAGVFGNLNNGQQIPLKLAIEYWIFKDSFSILAEVNAAVGLDGAKSDSPVEAYLVMKKSAGPVWLIWGGGGALAPGIGSAPWRAFAGVEYLWKEDAAPTPAPAPVPVPANSSSRSIMGNEVLVASAQKGYVPGWMSDRDNDGVPDNIDRCPDVPGVVEEQGCPERKPAPQTYAPLPPPAPVYVPQQQPVPQAPYGYPGQPQQPPQQVYAPPPQVQPANQPVYPAVVKPQPVGNPGDRDNDGVMDAQDECPDLPGYDWNAGCPIIFEKGRVLSFNSIVFENKTDKIKSESFILLNAIADALKSSRGFRVLVEGHTDNSGGNPGANMLLSQKRAQAVVGYLVGRGVEPERLSYTGFGDTEPIASNMTESGRRQNRRIEFRVVD